MHATSPVPLSSRFMFWWRRIGGGPLALSLAIHAVLILVAGLVFIHAIQDKPAVDFLPGQRSAAGDSATEALKNQIKTSKQKPLSRTRPMARIAVPMDHAIVRIQDTPLDLDDPPSPTALFVNTSRISGQGFDKKDFGSGFGGREGMTPFVTLMKGRCDMTERLRKLRDNGGNDQCERAVSNSLEWLRTKQNADGSWGRTHRGAMTGLALLCYLGRCYDTRLVLQ